MTKASELLIKLSFLTAMTSELSKYLKEQLIVFSKVHSCKLKNTLINDPLHASKVPKKFRILTFHNFAGTYPWNLQFS